MKATSQRLKRFAGGATITVKPDWGPIEKDMLAMIELEKLLAVERATVEKGRG